METRKMKSNEVILHGEVIITLSNSIPNNAQKIDIQGKYQIVGESESFGNHHVVDVMDGIDFYEDDKGTLFMDSKTDTKIRCLHANRHDEIVLPAGTYEFGIQKEYDPFTERQRNVAD